MSDSLLDVDAMLALNDDPRFITSIFNYCDRRCDRCAFRERCRLYADERRDEERHPNDDWQTRVHRSFQQTFHLLKRWCDREGIDFEEVTREAQSEQVAAELHDAQEATRRDPLLQLAERYTFPAMKLVRRLRTAAAFNTWPPDARDALDTIEWFGIRVSSKIHRAIGGCARRMKELEADPVQTDWNGSAKVARLDIAASRAAWQTILRIGHAAADSPLHEMITVLDAIDAGVAARFPDAMRFVRPGFDDSPRVAGAALDP